nr:unnamed protein product [Digitaria exilis]
MLNPAHASPFVSTSHEQIQQRPIHLFHRPRRRRRSRDGFIDGEKDHGLPGGAAIPPDDLLEDIFLRLDDRRTSSEPTRPASPSAASSPICPIPGGLDSSANGIIFYEPFLDPATDKEETEDEHLPVRVICNVVTDKEIRTLVFNSVTGKWRAVTSFAIIGTTATFRWLSCQGRRYYSCSCFCWTGYGRKEMLVLDTREMKFSVADLPRESYNRMHSVVDAEEGRLGLLILVGSRKLLIYSKTWPDNGDGLKDWQCDNVIPLFDCNWFFSSGGAEGYAVLKAVAQYQNQIVGKKSDTQYFIVEIKTLLIKRLCSMKPGTDAPHYLYASFPPPLSLPSL